jgi:hypothetical protein
MGLPSGGPLERLRLDPAAQDSGMCPTCEVMRDFLSSPGSYAPHLQTPLFWKSPGRSRECLVHQPGDEADAARRPARPTGHLTCEGLRDRVAESATFVNLAGGVGHPGCSAVVLVNLSSAVDRPCRTLDVEQQQPWKGCRWWARLNMGFLVSRRSAASWPSLPEQPWSPGSSGC